jgi:hypothetical protein
MAEASLESLGLPYGFLYGMPVDQTRLAPCAEFRDHFRILEGNWLGRSIIGFGDIGLVMGLDWKVEPLDWEDCDE